MYVCLSFHPHLSTYIYTYICKHIHPSIHIYLPTYLTIKLYRSLLIYLYVYLSNIYQPISISLSNPSTHLSILICLSIYLSLYLYLPLFTSTYLAFFFCFFKKHAMPHTLIAGTGFQKAVYIILDLSKTEQLPTFTYSDTIVGKAN